MDYIELKVEVSPLSQENIEIVIAQLAEQGFESFTEHDTGFFAYIKESNLIKSLNDLRKDIFISDEVEISWSTKTIKDQNWNKIWESNFEPIIVNDQCLVRASFHSNTPKVEYDIVIDPKMAFGTGHHQTTYLMIQAILNDDFKGKEVLDMGCGTGVLAILSGMKGAVKVLAVDIDEWAYNNTIENLHINKCQNIDVRFGGVEQIQGLLFDVILANINLNVLVRDIPAYYSALRSDGKIYLSGIIKKDIDILIMKCSEFGLSVIGTTFRDDWAMVSLEKKC